MSRRQYTVEEDQAINAYVLGWGPLVRGNQIWNQAELNKVSKNIDCILKSPSIDLTNLNLTFLGVPWPDMVFYPVQVPKGVKTKAV